MKYILTAMAGFLIFSSCKKQTACSLVPAKIIRRDCDRVVFQLLNNDFAGDTAWTDMYTGIRYTNVVSYYNTCAVGQATNGNFDTLFLNMERLTSPLFARDCIQCMIVTINNPVHTNVEVTEISTIACDGTRIVR